MSVDLYLTGDAGADAFTIVRSGSSDLIYHNQPLTSTPFDTVPISTLGTINIFGNGGADSVTLDFSGGDPIPGSLYFAAGGGVVHSTITVIGVAAGTGYAPNYTLSPGELTITNAAITDTIDFANVDQFDLFGSGGGSLTVAGGSVKFNQDLGASGGAVDVTVDDDASLYLGVTQHLDNLTIDSGGTAAMLPAGSQLLDTNNLTVDGVLDMADNDLIVQTPSAPASLLAAYDSGAAGSTGERVIFSSIAATDDDGMSFYAAPLSDISYGPDSMDGQSIASTAFIGRYTLIGDLNLDGAVAVNDFNILASHYGQTGQSWFDGDLNGDRAVGGNDFNLLAGNFGNTIGNANPTDVTAGTAFTLDLPTTTPSGATPVRFDINWGDGSFNSYSGYATTADHVFTTEGLYLVQFVAITDDPTTGYDSWAAPTQLLAVSADGVTATPLALTAAASTDTFDISSDDSGDTIVTKTTTAGTTTVADEPTADILSLSIAGDAANVTIDFTNTDPLPAAGIFSDAANITLTGTRGGFNPLVNTGTAALLGNDTIRYPAGTQLIDEVNSSTILALAGSTTLKVVPTGSDVTVATGATLLFDGSQSLNSLTIEPGGTAREISPVTTLGATVLNIWTLNIDSPDTQGDAGGVLDLGNGDLITSGTSLSTIQALLAAGYDNGFWDGQSTTGGVNPAAIVSSGAANDPYQIESLGYAAIGTAAGSLNLTSFDGQSVTSGDVVVGLTYYGDANLDRTVDDTDSGIVQDVVIATPIGWTTGDFNYDGLVDQLDTNLAGLAANLLSALTAGNPVLVAHPASVTSKIPAVGAQPIQTPVLIQGDDGNTYPVKVGTKTAVGATSSTNGVTVTLGNLTPRNGAEIIITVDSTAVAGSIIDVVINSANPGDADPVTIRIRL